jgi:hypothetical protein
MIQRLKKIWELSSKDLEVIEKLPQKGNGKAVFFSEPNAMDDLEHEREVNGVKPWYDRLSNL